MSTDKNEPEPKAENDGVGDAPKLASDPIDFTAVIDRLKSRAVRTRNTGRKNKHQSTIVTMLAVIALLMVVVGAEDVVRRQLSPDVRDVTAKRLTVANETARNSLELAAVKTAAANIAKAALAAIDQEFLTAKKATEDAETIENVRALLFKRRQTALTKKASADVNVKQSQASLSAAKLSTGNDIKIFVAAEEHLKEDDRQIAEHFEDVQRAETEYKKAQGELSKIEAKFKPKLEPISNKVYSIRDKAQKTLQDAQEQLETGRSMKKSFEIHYAETKKAFATASAAAKKAKLVLSSAENAVREAEAAAAISVEVVSRLDPGLANANTEAKAARAIAKELNSPGATKKRNEKRTKALNKHLFALETAKAAQVSAASAKETAREVAKASPVGTGPSGGTNIQQAITRGGAVAGAIGIAILLVQIFVNAMRYYARLAEFYDAQADALLASGGNPNIAAVFIDKFSPTSIDFGKTPVSIYEKALDTIKSAGLPSRTGN